jgi:hypothetical protein
MTADVPEDVRHAMPVPGQQQRHAEPVMRDRHVRRRQQGRGRDHLGQAVEQPRLLRREARRIGIDRGGDRRDSGALAAPARRDDPGKIELALGGPLPDRHVHRAMVRLRVRQGKRAKWLPGPALLVTKTI